MKEYEKKDGAGRLLCKRHHMINCNECRYINDLEQENENYRDGFRIIKRNTNTDVNNNYRVYMLVSRLLEEES